MNRKSNTTNEDNVVINSNNIGLIKEWLSYEDICFLYGHVSKKNIWKLRKKRKLRVSKHPFNEKVYIYNRIDVEKIIEQNIISSKEELFEEVEMLKINVHEIN